MLMAFVAWEYYLEECTTFPPLMRLDIWTRGKGRMAAVMLVAFFLVSPQFKSAIKAYTDRFFLVEWLSSLGIMDCALLPAIREALPDTDYDSVASYVRDWVIM